MQVTRFFRTTSSMNGTLFNMMGKSITIRQSVILGMGCGMVFMMALRTDNFMLLALAIIPLMLGIMRTKTMTADEYVMSLLSYAIGGGSTKKIKASRRKITSKRAPSKRIGIRDEDVKKVAKTDTIMKVPVMDKKKSIRLSLTILDKNGEAYANQFVSVYMDDSRVGAVSTDAVGKTAVTVIPGKFGMHKLRVMPRSGDKPLLDGVVEFVDE